MILLTPWKTPINLYKTASLLVVLSIVSAPALQCMQRTNATLYTTVIDHGIEHALFQHTDYSSESIAIVNDLINATSHARDLRTKLYPNFDFDKIGSFANYQFDYFDDMSSKRILDYVLKN